MRKYTTNLEIRNGEIFVDVVKTNEDGRVEEFEVPMEKIERYCRKFDINIGDEFVSRNKNYGGYKYVVTGKMKNDDIYFLMGSDGDIYSYTIQALKESFEPTGKNYPTIELVLNCLKSDEELLKDVCGENVLKEYENE